jgi:hypothetical protein
MHIYTADEAAKEIGCHVETVKRNCRKQNIGRMITNRLRVLTAQDVRKVRKMIEVNIARNKQRGKQQSKAKAAN